MPDPGQAGDGLWGRVWKALFPEPRSLEQKETPPRPWRLLQVETSLACNISCRMCPWEERRAGPAKSLLLTEAVWAAVRPHLSMARTVDLSGGGEPLLQPRLSAWLAEAAQAGCRAGLLTNGLLLDPARAEALLAAGLTWLGVSVDGAEATTYEKIRRGASFIRLKDNLKAFNASRRGTDVRLILQAVLTPENFHQIQTLVDLAGEWQADRLIFKQCDVVRRPEHCRLGLFTDSPEQGDVTGRRKQMRRALARAEARGLEAAGFSFEPQEQPACDQDPRTSLFVSFDGRVSACINLAYGGRSYFFGRETISPSLVYGSLPQDELVHLWADSPVARSLRDSFDRRSRAFEAALRRADLGDHSLSKLEAAYAQARLGMPAAPEGCRVCHYLYGV